jgi:hypothetical protein
MVSDRVANVCVASIPRMNARGILSSHQGNEERREKAAVGKRDESEESEPVIDMLYSAP